MAEAHRAENVPLRPWVGDPTYDVVEIVPEVVTGRAFALSRPWTHLRTARNSQPVAFVASRIPT